MTESLSSRSDRPDLAAMVVPLGRALADAELPVLRRHGLTMWGYVVLSALAAEPVRTQSALAEAIGADKTRIIAVLDDLQESGLIERSPDPSDRRARLLKLTVKGRRVRAAAQDGIREREERVLALLPAADRRGLLRSLRVLSELGREEFEAAVEG
ncbi:winged helix-turn-helix transcriptional regulator [Rhodococcus spelaei]|uniref:Winged helix-turn-helix transcriptional regulator n=1 Tax=Rhodococcus spelaei TaxID=2546320 RepID=A0A541AZ61_9NOCA|nr:MarR family winged helix-turn-helix transcriptional regulator [Rhodococcus spelaei]TQF65361.1 winged helix-turn-helix transcriptional regulator [Rhodococcus spelaei]